MLSTATFVFIFLGFCFLSFIAVRFLNRKAEPLRKAWNVYGAMYVLHCVLFVGLLLTLPPTSPPFRVGTQEIERSESPADVKAELQKQREEIEQLKNDVHATTQTIFFAAYVMALFLPMLYYNLFKYNLEIEKLSGKRMGSFD